MDILTSRSHFTFKGKDLFDNANNSGHLNFSTLMLSDTHYFMLLEVVGHMKRLYYVSYPFNISGFV